MRQGYLSYSEAMELTDIELSELSIAAEMVEKEIADEINRQMKKGR
jgi:hypothetical protein|nr:MAG TPA: hypothetical protein [Caudoviricetes sp.]